MINSFALQLEQMTGMMEILGMSRKQQAVWPEQGRKPFQYPELCFFIKINHYITTKYRIQLGAHVPVAPEQVKGAESDHGTQFRLYSDHAPL
jgi:hypothetical protein